MNLKAIVKQLKDDNYRCDTGLLENNHAFLQLEMIAEQPSKNEDDVLPLIIKDELIGNIMRVTSEDANLYYEDVEAIVSAYEKFLINNSIERPYKII